MAAARISKSVLSPFDRMEHEVAQLDLPNRYADRWYTLREHLWIARERLLKLRARWGQLGFAALTTSLRGAMTL